MSKKDKYQDNYATRQSFVRSNLIEIISILIALMALFLTTHQAIVMRYHNKLSVRPYLSVDKFTVDIVNEYHVSIKNRGLGPARITGIEVYVGKEFIRFKDRIENKRIINSLKNQQTANLDIKGIRFFAFGKDFYIDKGEVIDLMSLLPNPTKEVVDNFVKATESIDYGLCYSSMYGEKFYFKSGYGPINSKSCRFDSR